MDFYKVEYKNKNESIFGESIQLANSPEEAKDKFLNSKYYNKKQDKIIISVTKGFMG